MDIKKNKSGLLMVRRGTREGSWRQGNGLSCAVKCGDLLGGLVKYWLVRTGSVACS